MLAAVNGTTERLPALLTDRNTVVRAEASRLVVHEPTPEHIAKLFAMLESEHARCRFAAKDALLRIGAPATVQLAAHLAGATAHKSGAMEVAVGIAGPELLPAALRHSTDPDPTLRLWAAHLLAAGASPRARGELSRLLAEDPDGAVRAVAAQGLAALGDPTTARGLSQALTDPAWDVRRAAALSLRRLGPSGRIYLRRALSGDDRFAADMARQVLDEADAAAAL